MYTAQECQSGLPDIEGFEFSVVTVQWNDFEEPIIQSQTNHAA